MNEFLPPGVYAPWPAVHRMVPMGKTAESEEKKAMTDYAIPTEADEQASHALTLVDRAIAAAIADDRSYGSAGQMLSEVKAKASEIDSLEKSITKPINDGLRKIRDFFRVPKGRLYEAEQALENQRRIYRGKAEAEKRDAERAAQEASFKERERLEREAAALEEAARNKLEAQEAKARLLESAGKIERAAAARKALEVHQRITSDRAAALRHVAETWPTNPIVHREPPKTQGVHTVTRWHARVMNKSVLIKAVASGHVSEAVLTVDMAVLNRMAIALKEQINIPGVIAESTESESVRT